MQVHPACPVSDLFFICESLYSWKPFPSNGSPRRSFENRSPQLARRRLKVPHFENILDAVFVLLPGLVGWFQPSFAPTGWPTGSLLQAFPFSMIGFDRSKKSHLLLFYAYYMQVHKRMFWQKVFNACASYRIPFCDVVLFDKS